MQMEMKITSGKSHQASLDGAMSNLLSVLGNRKTIYSELTYTNGKIGANTFHTKNSPNGRIKFN